MQGRTVGAALLVTGLLLVEQRANADPLPTSAEHVTLPGRSVVSDDTSQAIVLNPANLAWLPAPELRWTWVHCSDEVVKVGCGHAWEVATPLLFGLLPGLRGAWGEA